VHSKDLLALTYSFQENGKTITDPNFLGLIEANAIVAKNNVEENTNTSFTLASPPEDGLFHQKLNSFDTVGDYDIHVFVDGKTFKREFKHSISVQDSYMVLEKNSSVTDDGKLVYSYKISTDEKVVDLSKTQVAVTIKSSQKNDVEKTLTLMDGKRWEFSFSPVQEGDYAVDIHAQGELLEGEKFDEVLHADNFSYIVKKSAATSSASAPVADSEPAISTLKTEPQAESNNLILYLSIGVGNLVLLLVGYFAYKFIMGNKTKNEFAEFEKTLSSTSSNDANSSAKKPAIKNMPEKTEIDLSDEDPASIPMNDEDNSMDKLFPLDNMEDSNNSDDRK
jgi:hypothetical protein